MSANDSFWGNYKPSRVMETAWSLYKFSKRSDEVKAKSWFELDIEVQAEFYDMAKMLIPDSLHRNHNYLDSQGRNT